MPILRKNNFSENPDSQNSNNPSGNSFPPVPFISTMLLLNGLVPENHPVNKQNTNEQENNISKQAKVPEKREGRFAKLLEVLESKPMPVSDAGLGKVPGALFEVFPKLTRNLKNNISNSSISFFEGVFQALIRASKKSSNRLSHSMPVISMPLCYVGDPRIEEESVFYSANV